MITSVPTATRPPVLLDQLLKTTTSRCPVCQKELPAEVWKTNGIPAKVLLKRRCPEHGFFEAVIASDARFYWLAKGRGCGEPGCCSADGSSVGTLGRNADPADALGIQEKLSTCLALIEIVNSCNLACPTCYADSPTGSGGLVNAVPIEQVRERIQGVINRKGGIEILQLSGGEPTLHPQFFELLRWSHANPGIDYVLLNTNGLRIAQDDAFAEELGRTFRYGKFHLPAIRRGAGSRSAVSAWRGLARATRAVSRTLPRPENSSDAGHDRHAGESFIGLVRN